MSRTNLVNKRRGFKMQKENPEEIPGAYRLLFLIFHYIPGLTVQEFAYLTKHICFYTIAL